MKLDKHISYRVFDVCACRSFCVECNFLLSTQNSLDWIGTRGNVKPGVTRERRIKYARDLLQKELLPHVGVNELCETKKVMT